MRAWANFEGIIDEVALYDFPLDDPDEEPDAEPIATFPGKWASATPTFHDVDADGPQPASHRRRAVSVGGGMGAAGVFENVA